MNMHARQSNERARQGTQSLNDLAETVARQRPSAQSAEDYQELTKMLSQLRQIAIEEVKKTGQETITPTSKEQWYTERLEDIDKQLNDLKSEINFDLQNLRKKGVVRIQMFNPNDSKISYKVSPLFQNAGVGIITAEIHGKILGLFPWERRIRMYIIPDAPGSDPDAASIAIFSNDSQQHYGRYSPPVWGWREKPVSTNFRLGSISAAIRDFQDYVRCLAMHRKIDSPY